MTQFGPGVVIAIGLSFVLGCGHVERKIIFDKTIDIPAGRFSGPIEIEVPRRADHKNRDFEIETRLSAACGPLLRLSFPDGEVATLGDEDEDWQKLLTRRALAGSAADGPAERAPRRGDVPATPGHWEAVRTESWPGQLVFLEQRKVRCAKAATYDSLYLNAFDESGRMTFWADTPQEIANAKITVKVYELIDVKAELEAAAKLEAEAKARAAGSISVGGSVRVGVDVNPTTPEPPPKKESPPPAIDPGATWVPGHWKWTPGSGKWVWIPGYWNPPKTVPGPKTENPGDPPTAGCTWAPGHWVWVQTDGSWEWVPGHWNAPPPRVENPGAPPVPESKWVPGYWVKVNGRFEWVAGYWGKPSPRAETPPPPPHAGARWVAGVWINVQGKWVWSPGYYERSGRPPPAPKAETPPPSPAPGSVWLGGFWRFSDAKNDYEWIAGHWEIPPGEGYVWVADPPNPALGVPISGHWELRVKVKTNGTIKVQP
ncbi:MAG: YXWGXW repeat-containing protein [Polyangiaceae bacterium]|nr:YXWGXW repeat-containing protein [Polyangiaceae bacterium]